MIQDARVATMDATFFDASRAAGSAVWRHRSAPTCFCSAFCLSAGRDPPLRGKPLRQSDRTQRRSGQDEHLPAVRAGGALAVASIPQAHWSAHRSAHAETVAPKTLDAMTARRNDRSAAARFPRLDYQRRRLRQAISRHSRARLKRAEKAAIDRRLRARH